jgi:hypothetical protein
MARRGEVIRIGNIDALYARHELVVLRGLIAASDAGRCSPEDAWRQIVLLHELKAQFGGVFVDAVEEAQIRRDWDASERQAEQA